MTLSNNPPFIVIFPKKNDIYCFQTLKDLTTSFPSDQKHFSGATIIDMNLELYKIREAIKTGWGNRFFGFTLFYKERVIKVDLVVDNRVTLSLERTKKTLVDIIERRPFGRFMSEFFRDKKNLVSKIEQADAASNLMTLFLYDE